jgi:UPF0755 protein
VSPRKTPRERTAAERAAAAAERAARRAGTPPPAEAAASVPPPAPEPEPYLEPEPEPYLEPEPDPQPVAAAAPRTSHDTDPELRVPPPTVSRPVSRPGARPTTPRARATGRSGRAPRAAAAARAARSRTVAGGPGGPGGTGRSVWRGVLGAILLLALIAGLVFAALLFQPFGGDGEGNATVVIPRGATIGQIGDVLAEKDVVSRSSLFALRARLAGKAGDIKAGTYRLRHGMSYAAALDALTTAGPAPPQTTNVTIPEGRARREIAPLVKQAGIKGSYLKASVRHSGFRPQRYKAPKRTKNLEGFLFPATYELKKSADADTLVGQQLDAFEKQFATVDLKAAKRKNLTPYDVLIIASMVEREAQLDKERRLVAAVIYNRLKQGMPLGIDATIRYGVNNWTRPLRVSELEADSPYNTRLNTGLPPTPIGNPGLASIKAAAKPAGVSYLYYVVKPNACGEHVFSSTDAKFQRDVARYNAEREKRGGKSPTDC